VCDFLSVDGPAEIGKRVGAGIRHSNIDEFHHRTSRIVDKQVIVLNGYISAFIHREGCFRLGNGKRIGLTCNTARQGQEENQEQNAQDLEFTHAKPPRG